MAISSLQSLVQKYGANFGLNLPKKNTDGQGADKPVPVESAHSKDPSQIKLETLRGPKDKVSLSQQALDYQKAHSLLDYLDANDNGDESKDSNSIDAIKALFPNQKKKPFDTLDSFLG